MKIQCIPMADQHLPAIAMIEPLAHSHPWSQSLLSDIAGRGACHHVMLLDERVIGYFYAQNIVGEVTLLNIAVAPEVQGKGYGKALMNAFLDVCRQQRAEEVWLEVRASNQTALSIYRKVGFNEVDRRVNYYPTTSGREDAVIMSLILD